MKKNILILAICAFVAFGFTSCKEEKTDYEIAIENLTTTKGWTLKTATCDPAYELAIGAPITDLFLGFLESCEKDDIIYFNENKSQLLNPGKDGQTTIDYVCADATEVALGNWDLSEDMKTLKFYLPYYRGALLEATVLTLSETTLTLNVKIKEDDEVVDPSKVIRNYTFNLSYTRN